MEEGNDLSKFLVSVAGGLVNLIVSLILLLALLYLVLVLISDVEGINKLEIFAGKIDNIMTGSSRIIVSLLTISVAAFALAVLVLFARWLSKDEEEIVILPFNVPEGEKEYSGIALAHLLIAELVRIRQIDTTEYEGVTPIETEKVTVPIVKPSSENLASEISKIGTLEAGTISVPLGQVLVSIKKLWPFGTNSSVISGCLQKYGTSTSLIACLEHQDMMVWEARNSEKRNKKGDEIIPDLSRDLAFMIVHYFSSGRSMDEQKNLSTVESVRDESTDKKISAKTWQGLKHFYEALNAYHQYKLTDSLDYLKLAQKECNKAVDSEIHYERLIKLVYNLAIAFINKKMYSDAETLLIKAKEIKQDDFQVLSGLGYLYIEQEKYKDANDYFDTVTKLYPDSMGAWVNKGNALFALGKHLKALDCYNKAIKLNGKYVYAWNGKGNALFGLGRNNEALACYIKALDLNQKYAGAWNGKGAVLLVQGKNKEALICFDKAIDLDRKSRHPWNNKGMTLDRMVGREEYAMQAYEEANKLGMKSAELHIALARLYRKLGKEFNSYDACKTARDLMDREYSCACFEAVCGSPDAALDLLRTALDKKQETTDWARQDPAFESIWDDPRFWALLDELSPSPTPVPRSFPGPYQFTPQLDEVSEDGEKRPE